MKKIPTFEEYKAALLDAPSQRIQERLLEEADTCGFTALQMAELSMAGDDPWA